MQRVLGILLLLLLCGSCFAGNAQNSGADNSSHPATAAHHVIMQLTSADTSVWNAVIHNIHHLREAFNNDVAIEVVCHGPGIAFLTKTKATQQAAVSELATAGVQFMGCQNTMRAMHLTKSDLLPQAGTVPSGVAEVVMKEEQGWSYLKMSF